MTQTIYFNSNVDSDKKVEMTVRERNGDLHVVDIKIGSTFFTGKQIRTANREQVLLAYAEKYGNLSEIFPTYFNN